MTSIEKYSLSLVNALKCNRKRKIEYFNEFADHIEESKLDLIRKGYEEKEAESMAINLFGNKKDITVSLNKELFYFGNVTRNIFIILLSVYLFFLCFCFVLEPFRSILQCSYSKGRILNYNEVCNIIENSFKYKRGSMDMNIIPFKTVFSNFSLSFWNYYKIIIFMPFGFFFSAILYRKRFLKYMISISFIFGIELIQHYFSLGVGDIDDSLNYFTGFISGILVYRLMVIFLSNTFKINLKHIYIK